MTFTGFAALDRQFAGPPGHLHDDPLPESPSPVLSPLRPDSLYSNASAPYSPSRGPIKRKPLPPTAHYPPQLAPQPLTNGPSAAAPGRIEEEQLRPPVRHTPSTAFDSPTLPYVEEEESVSRDIDRFPRAESQSHGWQGWGAAEPLPGAISRKPLPKAQLYPPTGPLTPSHARNSSESTLAFSTRSHTPSEHHRSSSLSTMAVDTKQNHHSLSPSEAYSDVQKSPTTTNRFTTFFRWGSTSEQGGASSPGASPSVEVPPALSSSGKSIPPAIDIPLANALHAASDSGISMRPLTPTSVEAIEEEVRIVSADLAASIRREMDLEDLVERLQSEAAERNSEGGGRRTSDYFSDAGTPVRLLDLDVKPDYDIEKMMRKAEQEKAQLRLEMFGKVQDERERRKVLEAHARDLEDKIAQDTLQLNVPENPSKIRELEVAVDDARRKLAEERQMKENFEDLLAALKEQLAAQRNERDNLRDEIVPRLRARVEGLESEASAMQAASAEHSRMQQELANLRNENASLAAAIQSRARQSQTGSPSGYATPSSPQMGPSNNNKDRESLEKRLKDVEAQRDALHKALKSLRDRQQYESRKSMERIKALETERERNLHQGPGRDSRRDREVSSLRREVDRLRKRADDALEQKFVCERNLGTLKMDLEKAEQETGTLRILLQEHDDLISRHSELQISHVRLSQQLSELRQEIGEASSVSLQRAYKDLQEVHERSLARLDELEANSSDPLVLSEREKRLSESLESQRTIETLRRSLTAAEINRDSAVAEAEGYRKRAESLQKSEQEHIAEERKLATQLRLSSERVEEMAAQVTAQLQSNDNLRERLADAIMRGEQDQKMSAQHINNLQGRLKVLEDNLLEAQHAAEEAVAQHEEEIREIRETHTSQLRRMKTNQMVHSPRSPSGFPLLKSPKLEWTAKRISKTDGANTKFLEKRVEELERALADADEEMAEVVGRMNAAQIEVLELQSERDEAARQTRRLQTQMVAERVKYSSMALNAS